MRNLYAKFRENKPSRNGKITLSFIDIDKSCPNRYFFHITCVSFDAIRENKILAKISESTVFFAVSRLVVFNNCGRPWPAASINISRNIHQNQVLIEPLYSA